MNPGILEPFSDLWRVFWSRMGTLENHWLWFDPLVGKGFLSLSESGHA
jgi:hypothetical protein